jgi:hypothetical protein
MARVVIGIGVLFVAVFALAQPALADGGGGDLEQRIAHLRQKAAALREKGSAEDAEHVAKLAEILEKVRAIRRESNELERRAKELRANGREGEAARAMEESGRLWRTSEEMLRKVEAKTEHRKHADDVAHKVRELEKRVLVLREDGKPLEAEETERLLALLRAARGEHAVVVGEDRPFVRGSEDAAEHRKRHERAERVRKAVALLREAGLPDLAALVERETKDAVKHSDVTVHVLREGDFRELTSYAGRRNAEKKRAVTFEPKYGPGRPPLPPAAHAGEIAALRDEVRALRQQMEELRAVVRDLRATAR